MPRKAASVASRRAPSRLGTSARSTISPSASPVSVRAPNSTVNSYRLPPDSTSAMTFVASSRHSGNMPVAMGSSVPTCPALLAPKALRTRCRVPLDVRPRGLSMTMMPVGKTIDLVLVLVRLHGTVDETRELVGMFDLLVVDELELGRMAQRERAADLTAQESGGAIQPLAHLFRRMLVSEGHEEHARA